MSLLLHYYTVFRAIKDPLKMTRIAARKHEADAESSKHRPGGWQQLQLCKVHIYI